MKKSKIPPELLQKLKSSINIIEVIGEHVVLRKSGINYVGLCPFHSERSPSFNVSEQKQLYHCYGCQQGGDLIAFQMEMQGLSFSEAIEDLADRAKFKLPEELRVLLHGDKESDLRRTQYLERENLAFKLNRYVAGYFHQNLNNDRPGKAYLHKRGVNDAITQSFYIGTASDSWDNLSEYLIQRKAPIQTALELGLIRPSQKMARQSSQSGYFDLFRNRVIFPILNLRGKVAGFGGRSLGDEMPKYLNSSESQVFQKGKLAFGLYQAQKFIRELDQVILVEGYFDVMAMHRMGFQNVVATCGTALTREHLLQFQRFAKKVILLFDGDRAGVAATERAMEIGLENGHVLYSAQLPENKDPDELFFDQKSGEPLPEGKAQMTAILEGAKADLDTRIESILQAAGQNPEERVLALKKIGTWLEKLKDPIGREVRLKWIQDHLSVPRQFLQEIFGKEIVREAPVRRPQNLRTAKPPKKGSSLSLSTTDRILLSGIMIGPPYQEYFFQAKEQLPAGLDTTDLIESLPVRQWVQAALTAPGGTEKLRKNAKQALEESLVDLDSSQTLHSLLSEVLLVDSPGFTLQDYQRGVNRSLTRLWAQFSQQIKKAIAQAEKKMDPELYTKLMKEYLDVQRKMKEFIRFYDQTSDGKLAPKT